MKSVLWMMPNLLIIMAACTSSPPPEAKNSPSMSEAERVSAARKVCEASDVSIDGSHIEGVSGGGLSFSIGISSKNECILKEPLSVVVLDANDKPITVGIAKLSGISDEGSEIAGEWRNVCTPAVFPLKVAVSWRSGVVRGPLGDATGLPVASARMDLLPSGHNRLLVDT